MADFSLYAGRWVTLNEASRIVSVGTAPEEAQHSGRQTQPKEHLQLVWISPHPPYLPLPAWPLRQLHSLLQRDQIWLVGGAVRDLLLKRPLHDWDFAVRGSAMKLARCIADQLAGAYITLDAERDTSRVIIKDPATQAPVVLDFATLRGADLDTDLRWRDFTINAIALTLEGELIDPLNGRADLTAQLVRATSTHTFTDDPARLLRAVRTAGELGFQLEAGTLAALRQHSARISEIATERIQVELLRIIAVTPAVPHLQLLQAQGLLPHILPEVSALRQVQQSRPHHYATVWGHTLSAIVAGESLLAALNNQSPSRYVRRCVPVPAGAWEKAAGFLQSWQIELRDYLQTPVSTGISRGMLLKWGLLFHDIGKRSCRTVDAADQTHFYGHPAAGAELAQHRLRVLHFPNSAIQFVSTLVDAHMRLLSLSENAPPSRRAIYRFFQATGEVGVGVVLLSLADTLAVWGPALTEEHWQQLLITAQALLQGYYQHPAEVVTPAPLLTGHDLLAMGIPAGPEMGRLLAALREAQAAGEINTVAAARAFIRQAWTC
ncbi:MAG: HD domain-containing protein [Chloroflexota bacterium]|nr:HD domain-containing protein [Chloroflexota bacterium]